MDHLSVKQNINGYILSISSKPVADPGFPVGGGIDSRGGYVLKNLYIETKESGPFGRRGGCARNVPPRSANESCKFILICNGHILVPPSFGNTTDNYRKEVRQNGIC